MNMSKNLTILYGKHVISNIVTYNPKRIKKIIFQEKNINNSNIYKHVLKKNSI